MLPKIIEKYTAIYSSLSDAEKSSELKKIRFWENWVSGASFILLVGTRFSSFGIGKSIINAMTIGGLGIEYLLFPVLITILVALARTTKNVMPLVFLLAASLVATIITFGALFYYLPYSLIFAYTEIKLIAMKMVPGYPLFENLTEDVFLANTVNPEPSAQMTFGDEQESSDGTMKEIGDIVLDDAKLDEVLGVAVSSKAEEMDELVIPEEGVTDNAAKNDR